MDDAPPTIETLITMAASVAGLAIEPHQCPGVAAHLKAARRFAELLEAMPLPPEAENAPVFRP